MNDSRESRTGATLTTRDRLLITFTMLGLAVCGGAAALLVFRSTRGMKYSLWWLPILALVMVGLPLLLALVMKRRANALRVLVSDNAGKVCPKCMHLLEPADAAIAVDSTGSAPLHCRKCGKTWRLDELRGFWDRLATDPMDANAWLATQTGAGNSRANAAAWMLRHRRSVTGILIGNFVMWTALGVIMAAVRGVSLIGGVFTFLHMALVMSGFLLLSTGWKRRVGEMPCCAKCGYQRGPAESASTSAVCPECGSDWHAIGGVVYGLLNRRPGVMVLGAILLALGVLAITSPLTRRGWQYSFIPTGSIIREITASDTFTMDEWNALRKRTLTAEQESELAVGLLDKRLRRGFISADADNWIVGQITAGRMPQSLLERYYREVMDIWLIAPVQAKIGEAVTVSIGTRYRHASTNNPKPEALISGFFVDDDLQPRERQTSGISGIMLGAQRLQTGDRDYGPGAGPRLSLIASTPGKSRVRLDLWIVHLPTGWKVDPIQWQPDGTPVIPSGVAWVERRQVEHVVDVIP